ncbi:MAG: hypothetical protein O7D30_11970 [Rickettsia endosymbiont of Ixodes persulcatus]|nr:hypothetical protein [Rickettsia endosymbiont of Ixodes persulcatus]
MISRAVLSPGDKIITSESTFGLGPYTFSFEASLCNSPLMPYCFFKDSGESPGVYAVNWSNCFFIHKSHLELTEILKNLVPIINKLIP